MNPFKTSAIAIALVASSTSAYAGWFSDETPPANAKPLSDIIKALEDQGYRSITEVEFERGVWEIEAHQADGEEVEIKIDPVSGNIQSRS